MVGEGTFGEVLPVMDDNLDVSDILVVEVWFSSNHPVKEECPIREVSSVGFV